jgi:hypothetical protein
VYFRKAIEARGRVERLEVVVIPTRPPAADDPLLSCPPSSRPGSLLGTGRQRGVEPDLAGHPVRRFRFGPPALTSRCGGPDSRTPRRLGRALRVRRSPPSRRWASRSVPTKDRLARNDGERLAISDGYDADHAGNFGVPGPHPLDDRVEVRSEFTRLLGPSPLRAGARGSLQRPPAPPGPDHLAVWMARAGQRPDRHLSAHAIRRSLITNALENGAPLYTVQRSVHHANPMTTEGYDANRMAIQSNAEPTTCPTTSAGPCVEWPMAASGAGG